MVVSALDKTISKVLSKISPTEAERKKVEKIVEEAVRICEKASRNARVIVCGSFAKDTYLSGVRDVDIFFILPAGKPVEIEGIEEVEKSAKALGGKYEMKKAAHPYITAHFKDFKFDLVPAYDFTSSSEIISAVDRTPLHAEYINSHLSEKNEARLIKAFARGIGVYGADSKAEGFSGYLCELLAVKYGSFQEFLRNAKDLSHPLEFKDPVDEERNVSSALSKASLEKMKEAAKAFLKKPSDKFFFPKAAPKACPPINPKKTLCLVYTSEERLQEDALHSKARSELAKLADLVSSFDFVLEGSEFAVDKETREVIFLLSFQKAVLQRVKTVEGPPLSVRREYLDAFVAKHGKKNTFYVKDRLFARQERKIFQAKQAVVSMGRTFLPSFEIVETRKGLQAIYSAMPDESRRKIVEFLSSKRSWSW